MSSPSCRHPAAEGVLRSSIKPEVDGGASCVKRSGLAQRCFRISPETFHEPDLKFLLRRLAVKGSPGLGRAVLALSRSLSSGIRPRRRTAIVTFYHGLT